MSDISGQVKVPAEYFAKSKLEYSNWRRAFFRELVQNSYDAGATKINFAVQFNPEQNICTITCADNGSGMDESTIVDVLLCLGASKKPDNAIGGFGYAKSLLYFAHKEYSIFTRDLSVCGSGGSYTLSRSAVYVQGTTSIVSMHSTEQEAQLFVSVLVNFASQFRPDREFSLLLNGRPLELYDGNTKALPMVERLPFGKLWFTTDAEQTTNKIIVSVRGLPMFEVQLWKYTTLSIFGYLEIDSDKGFSVLTANRDQLNGQHLDAVTALVKRLGDNAHFLSKGLPVIVSMNMLFEESTETTSATHTVAGGSLHYSIANVDFPKNFCVTAYGLAATGHGRDEKQLTLSLLKQKMRHRWIQRLAFAWKFCVFSVLASDVAKKYFGGRCWRIDDGSDVDHKDFAAFVEDDCAFKLANGDLVSTGFVFADGVEGSNSRNKLSGTSYTILSVNPDFFDKKFWISDLLDVAIHECVHICAQSHDESFVNLEIALRRSTRRLFKEAEIKENIRNFLQLH